MEDNIALLTSGFVLMRFIELAALSFILYRVLRRDPQLVRAEARNSNTHERARTAHSDKD